jgi:hypothetical protein
MRDDEIKLSQRESLIHAEATWLETVSILSLWLVGVLVLAFVVRLALA